MNNVNIKSGIRFKDIIQFTTLIILFGLSFSSSLKAQTASKLQILLPGMVAAPGSPTGYTGEPYSQSVGIPFQIIINAVDANWNVVSNSDQISISSSDLYANLPLPTNLVNGTATITVTLNSVGTQALSVHDDTNPAIQGATSPALTVVELGFFTISTIGDPWWAYPGQVTVGEELKRVEITARDGNGNRAYDYNGYVNLTEHTDYGIGRIHPETVRLEAGKWKGSLYIYRAGKKHRDWGVTGDVWIRVNDSSIDGESNRFCALPGQFEKLLTVVPGENHLPGSITGRSGSPSDQQAGKNFLVDVYATDEYYNQKTDIYHDISFSSSDQNADLPSPKSLYKGHTTASVVLNTQGTHTITTSDINNSSIHPGVSSFIRVLSYELDHFVINAISSPQVAGQNFPVIITAVDAQGNLIGDFSGTLDLQVSTGIQTITPKEIEMTNGWWSGEVTLTKASSLVNITVRDRTSLEHIGTSNQFEVRAGEATRLQVLLPGETATPGISPGKTGSPGAVLAGTSIGIRINGIDDWWNVNPNISDVIHLTSSDPEAILPPDASLSNGTRQFVVTLNSTGLQTVTAFDQSQPSIASGTSSQIFVNPGNLHHFGIDPISSPVTAGSPFTVTFKALDAFGNRIENYSGLVNLTCSTGEQTITPTQIYFNQGIFVGNVTLTKAEEGVFLLLSDNTNPPHTGSSNEFRVIPGALAKFQILVPGLTATPGLSPGFIGVPQDQRSGQPFSIKVNGVDGNWNVVTTAVDSFGISSTDSLASLPNETILVNGSRNLSIILNGAGPHTISAFHLNNEQISNGQSPLINVIPQDLDHFTFHEVVGPVTAGESFQITVRAETNLNEKVYNFSGTVHLLASTGEGTILPNLVGPFVNGEWTGTVTLTKAAAVSLSASDDANPVHSGSSNLFTVLPGSFARLQILLPGEEPKAGVAPGKTGVPLDQFTGIQFDTRIFATDEYWNLVSQVQDSIKLTSTDSQALLPGNSKLINGKATLVIIMGSAGIHKLTAQDITQQNILADQSSNFYVNPGTLDHFVFDPVSDQVAGTEFQSRINAVDIAGNTVSGFNGHGRLQSSTGAGTFSPSEIEFVDGVWSGKITFTKAAENVRLTCLDFTATPHTGQSNLFDILPGLFTHLQILLPGESPTPGIAPGKIGEVGTIISGEAINTTVLAVDNWWNPVPTATGIIGLTSTDEHANLPLDANLISGTVTFGDLRLNTPGFWTITAHCKSDPQISSDTSPLIQVISGSVASFIFDPISSPQIAGDTLEITVKAVDGSETVVSSYNEMASMTASTGPGTILVDEIQFVNGIWQGTVVLTKAIQSVHLNIHDFEDVVRGNSNPFTLLPGALAKLQILVPGETASPGLIPAKTGFPSPQTLGITFDVKVNATDAWYNPVNPGSLNLHFMSSDQEAILPTDTVQTQPAAYYPVTMLSVGKQSVMVEALGTILPKDTSSSFTVLTGQVDHFVFTKIDSQQVAGEPFWVRIEAQNQYNFPVTDYDGELILSASTGNNTLSQTGVTLANGFWEGELEITRADSEVVIYAADYVPAPNTHTGYSNSFRTVPNVLAGLQVLLPGETGTPGIISGKKGSPVQQTAGIDFSVVVKAVDAYWNLIREREDTLDFTISDTFAVQPDSIQLENGMCEVPVIIQSAGAHFFSAKIKDSSIPVASSAIVPVTANMYTQLLLLLPGEANLPGDREKDPLKTPGRSGASKKQTSGLPFVVEIQAVDDYWNPISIAPTDQIGLFTTDNSAVIYPLNTNLIEGKASFSVTLNQGGNQIIRALNISNPAIRTSLEGFVEVLIGGLHYQININTQQVAAGEPFELEIAFKNGIGEKVTTANHLVYLTLVDAVTLSPVSGGLDNSSFNLQNGSRLTVHHCNKVGNMKIKITDDLGTLPAYSDPIEITAGGVAQLTKAVSKMEIKALGTVVLSTELLDIAGNPVANSEVDFSIITGSGSLKQNSALSDENGMVSVEFIAGKVSEINVVRAQVDSVFTDFEIVVNLTSSSISDGVPINYPNPFGAFTPITHIDYYLAEDADVSLQIFDLFGNLVWTKNIAAGTPGGIGRQGSDFPNSVVWDGTNDRGQKVGSGGYILVAKANSNGRNIMNAKRKIAVIR